MASSPAQLAWQFGKNHLRDRDEQLSANHQCDQFFGDFYHLNAEEEPENEDYPGDMVLADGATFRETFDPHGVIKSSPMARSKTLARSPKSAWRRWTKKHRLLR